LRGMAGERLAASGPSTRLHAPPRAAEAIRARNTHVGPHRSL
jgi:hypothetical protein